MKTSFEIDPLADNEISRLILRGLIHKHNVKKATAHKKFDGVIQKQLNLNDEEMSYLKSFKTVIIIR